MGIPRRIVTGYDSQGRAVIVSDGEPPCAWESNGTDVSELWHLQEGPWTPLSGGDSNRADAALSPGGIAWRMSRLPPTGEPARNDTRAVSADARIGESPHGGPCSDTLSFVQLLGGRAELTLDDGCVELGTGDCVVLRGTRPQWRVLGDETCTMSSVTLRPLASGGATQEGPGLLPRTSRDPVAPRRVVTQLDANGTSNFASDAPVANALTLEHGAGMAFAEIWQTLGPLRSPSAGGDQEEFTCAIHPAGNGVSWVHVVVPPAAALARADLAKLVDEMTRRAPGLAHGGERDPNVPGRHRTQTIDFVQILDGKVTLGLDDGAEVDLEPGDSVIQRGTWHTWTNKTDRPCLYQAIQIATNELPD